jgi:hypothetical protein
MRAAAMEPPGRRSHEPGRGPAHAVRRPQPRTVRRGGLCRRFRIRASRRRTFRKGHSAGPN